ncbi:hypothetical protein HMPREF9554_02287 [Treponema phagedenis F0421]|nr:hypothetical protein HMPREF9554_02287 [Treponema phagedenis F0421]
MAKRAKESLQSDCIKFYALLIIKRVTGQLKPLMQRICVRQTFFLSRSPDHFEAAISTAK